MSFRCLDWPARRASARRGPSRRSLPAVAISPPVESDVRPGAAPARLPGTCPSVESWFASQRRTYLANAAVQHLDHLVDLLCCHHQRRTKGQPVRIEAAEQPVGQGTPAHPEAKGLLGREWLSGPHVADK